MPKYKIAIGLTTGNHMTHVALPISLIKMMSGRDWSNYEFTPLHENSIYIELNRNNIVVDYLNTDSEYLFFWDADNGLFPEYFDVFMDVMDNNDDVNILSGEYYRKTPQVLPESGIKIPVHGVKLPGQDMFTSDENMFPNDGLYNLSTMFDSEGLVGTGCLMVRKKVFEKMEHPWFRTDFYTSTMFGKVEFVTEDTYFCLEAQKAGFDIHLDTRLKSPHYAGGESWPKEWHQFPPCNWIDNQPLPVVTGEDLVQLMKEK